MDASHSGCDCHRYIEPLIRERAAELLVVSPYIDAHYARVLVDVGRRKRVRVITSADSEGALRRAIAGSGVGMLRHAKALLVIGAMAALTAFLGLYFLFIVLAALLAGIIGAGYIRHRRILGSNIRVRVARGMFVHEKLYISDGTAITGSANLTYSGLHRNMEHVEVTRKRERIGALRAHFRLLWRRV